MADQMPAWDQRHLQAADVLRAALTLPPRDKTSVTVSGHRDPATIVHVARLDGRG
jgi:hypothetical protein